MPLGPLSRSVQVPKPSFSIKPLSTLLSALNRASSPGVVLPWCIAKRSCSHRSDANAAWLEIIMAATDLVAWAKLLGFKDQPDLAKSEIDTFPSRALHVPARTPRGARQIRLRID